jgi:cell division protease FtsH
VTVVSGPELKSKWVGESEENLRQVFTRARQAAPAIIVFDELDSFATARGTYQGSGVEHSMVNQLLTEMDGFRKDELVFVVGTTNFVESLDPALLRPGRFEFHLHIPYPSAEDRRAILSIYDEKLGLQLSQRALDYAVKRTSDFVEGQNTRYSGDHLQALCRAMARMRLRERRTGPLEVEDVEKALSSWADRHKLSPKEELVVATHEAGHAVVSLFCPTSPPIDRISILGDFAAGYVRHAENEHATVRTFKQMMDQICVLYGGREAEALFFQDVSWGSGGDLNNATDIARSLVEDYGLGGPDVGVRRVEVSPTDPLSEAMKAAMERGVNEILETQRKRAQEIIRANKELVRSLRDLLVQKKVLDAETLVGALPKTEKTDLVAAER